MLDGFFFQVEFADAVGAFSWQTQGVTQQIVSDDGTEQEVLATLPAGAGQRFVRLVVSEP